MRRPSRIAALLLAACAVPPAPAPPPSPGPVTAATGALPGHERDFDGDGFVDPKDRCPRAAGVDPHGCPLPDRDGDGIADGDDQCRSEAGGKPYGCPDADDDTIPDKFDRCVAAKEVWNGLLDDDGCPDKLPEDLESVLGVARGVTFEEDWILAPASRRVLDRIAAVLARYPDFRIAIVGHSLPTDIIEYGWIPAKHRASTVMEYLMKRGIPRARMEPMDAEAASLWDAPRDHDVEILLDVD